MTEKFINRTISILYRYNQRFFTRKLEEYSLPIEVGQIPTLLQIYKNPGITQEGISSNVGIDKGTVAHIIKQLEKSGIVSRQTDSEDRRINHIYVTQKGMESKELLYKIIKELHGVLYQGFCDSEVEGAIEVLERMRKNMNNYLIEGQKEVGR